MPKKAKKGKNTKYANSAKIAEIVKVVENAEIAKIAEIPEIAETNGEISRNVQNLGLFGKIDWLFGRKLEFHSKSLNVANLF